jgi:hypothetical protein
MSPYPPEKPFLQGHVIVSSWQVSGPVFVLQLICGATAVLGSAFPAWIVF